MRERSVKRHRQGDKEGGHPGEREHHVDCLRCCSLGPHVVLTKPPRTFLQLCPGERTASTEGQQCNPWVPR